MLLAPRVTALSNYNAKHSKIKTISSNASNVEALLLKIKFDWRGAFDGAFLWKKINFGAGLISFNFDLILDVMKKGSMLFLLPYLVPSI